MSHRDYYPVLLTFIDFAVFGVLFILLLMFQYLSIQKIPHIHERLCQTENHHLYSIDPYYRLLQSGGIIGRNGLFGLYFFYLVWGKTYYWHGGRRRQLRLATHTVPAHLKRCILIPGWIAVACMSWVIGRYIQMRLFP